MSTTDTTHRVSSPGDGRRSSKSESMLVYLREGLSRQKPSNWNIVRQKYSSILSLNAMTDILEDDPVSFERLPHVLPSLKLAFPGRDAMETLHYKHTDDFDRFFAKRRKNMVATLSMMGVTSTPKYSHRTTRFSQSTISSQTSKLTSSRTNRSFGGRMLQIARFKRNLSLANTNKTLRKSLSKEPLERLGNVREITKLTKKGMNGIQPTGLSGQSTDSCPDGVTQSDVSSHEGTQKVTSGRLKRLARLLILLFRGWRLHSKKVHEILDGFSSLPTNTDEVEKRDDVMFDLADFKINKEGRLSLEIQQLLKLRPPDRSEEDIQKIHKALKNYKSVLTYPMKMQRLIAERAWYETYGAQKVIVREGHLPMRYYCILSGSAVVCVMDDENLRLKTIVNLRRGDSFGELAIMNGSRRQSTVISQEAIELLCITYNDYVDIFMSGGMKDPNDEFLKSLWYLQDWPLSMLIANPQRTLISYFKRQTVLVPDSNASDWLYIIKSGSCDVFMRLKKVGSRKRGLPKKVEDFRQQILFGLRAEDDRYLNHEQRLQIEMDKRIEMMEKKNSRIRMLTVPEINIETMDSYDRGYVYREPSDLQSTRGHGSREKSTLERLLAHKPYMEKPKLSRAKPVESKSNDEDGLLSLNENILFRRTGSGGQGCRDMVRRGAIDVKNYPKAKDIKMDKNSLYVVIETLVKGEVFGLHELVYQRQPSMCLVSNGAECVMINKKFYLEHASDSLIRTLRSEVNAFPSEKKLQTKLEADNTWDYLRKQTINQSVEKLKFKKVDVNDARSRFPSKNAPTYV